MRNLAFDVSRYAHGRKDPPHQHAELQLSMVLKGRISERVGSRTEYARTLSVVCKDPGVMHANDFGIEGARMVRLSLRESGLRDLLDDSSRADEWRWTHSPFVAKPFIRIARRAMTDSLQSVSSDDPDVLDLLAAFSVRSSRLRKGVRRSGLLTR